MDCRVESVLLLFFFFSLITYSYSFLLSHHCITSHVHGYICHSFTHTHTHTYYMFSFSSYPSCAFDHTFYFCLMHTYSFFISYTRLTPLSTISCMTLHSQPGPAPRRRGVPDLIPSSASINHLCLCILIFFFARTHRLLLSSLSSPAFSRIIFTVPCTFHV